jgi:phenylalanyl-tRNA synthetase alpha chain
MFGQLAGGKSSLNEQTVVAAEVAQTGQGIAFKHKWIKKAGDNLVPLADSVDDPLPDALRAVAAGRLEDAKTLAELKRRKLTATRKIIHYDVRKGTKYARSVPAEHTDLTSDMLADDSWSNGTFKAYNFKALGAPPATGALHPLMKVRSEICKIFIMNGFIEMPTNRYDLG